MNITSEFRRYFYRAQRLANVPEVIEALRFRELRARYYDALWREAAAEIGASAATTTGGYLRIDKDGLSTFVRQDRVMLDSHLMLDLMGNKAITYALIGEKGCPIPAHRKFTVKQLDAASRFMAEREGPVAVKPVSGTGGGNGVTTGIRTIPALRRAARYASRFDTDLLVEEEIAGHSYRLLYLGGALIHAVRRDPPVLVGDGKRSLSTLAKAETQRRLSANPATALSPLRLDGDAVNWLAEQNLGPSHVPEAGRTITAKKAVNQNAASQNHTVTHDVHPDTAAACGRLVKDLGVEFAGVDILSKDIAVPLEENGGCIGEINTTPGIHHHHLTATPATGLSVAARVLGYMFETGRGTMRLAAIFSAGGMGR